MQWIKSEKFMCRPDYFTQNMEKAKILIVEDDLVIAMDIEEILRSLDYDVISSVDTGEKAIKVAKTNKPDIVLMDIQINGDMDGIETADIIRSRFGTPVIFSTANLNIDRIEQLNFKMPFGYIFKPIRKKDLKKAIEVALYTSKISAEKTVTEEVFGENEAMFNQDNSRDSNILEWSDPQYEGAAHPADEITKQSNEKDRSYNPGYRQNAGDYFQSEETLNDSGEKYKELINNSQDLVYSTDQAGKITFISPSVLTLTGYSIDEAMGMDIAQEIYLDPLKRKFFLAQLIEKGSVQNFEAQLIRKDGSIWWASANATLNTNKQGDITGVEGIVRDITDRKLAEEKLQLMYDNLEKQVDERKVELKLAKEEAELACRAKSDFLSNISHELRTPMHQILNFAQFGLKKYDKVTLDKLFHYFSAIDTSGKQLMVLLDDLLNLTKLESGKIPYRMQKIDLNRIINLISNEFEATLNEKLIDLVISECQVVAEIFCDQYKISQVLRNLLSNAIKFSLPDGHITISCQLDSLKVGCNGSGDKEVSAIRFNIKDDGIGIPETEKEMIFGKFNQSSITRQGSGGVGLGLAICREIINAHLGKIWAVGNPDGGSTFSFTLPYNQGEELMNHNKS